MTIGREGRRTSTTDSCQVTRVGRGAGELPFMTDRGTEM